MPDVFGVAELLVNHAVEKHGVDIDLIAYYGSQARGDARPESDLDLFYTPAGGKHPPIARTFLLDGLLFDFWELTWETLDGFATGDIRGWAFAPALVRQATPLYVRTPEQANRLARLQERSRELENDEHRSSMRERAQDSFVRVVECLGRLRVAAHGPRMDVVHAGWQLIHAVWECLALANQVTFERGFSKALEECDRFAHRPENLPDLVRAISTSSDVGSALEAADELTLATHHIIQDLAPIRPANLSIQKAFDQAYPELRDNLRKLLTACEEGDHESASLEAYHLQREVASIMSQTQEGRARKGFSLYHEYSTAYRDAGFPDLMTLASGSLDDLADAARRLDQGLRNWLVGQDVALCEVATIEELRSILET